MGAYRIKYTRKDMPCPCFTIKHAHSAKDAERLLKASLQKKKVLSSIVDTKEILDD